MEVPSVLEVPVSLRMILLKHASSGAFQLVPSDEGLVGNLGGNDLPLGRQNDVLSMAQAV